MRLTVKLFARARDLAGAECVELDLSGNASPTVSDLKEALSAAYPVLAPLAGNLLIAVDTAYATDDTPLAEGADVACFPPVSGG